MRILKAALAVLFVCLSAGAWAQGSLLQSGPPVNGHAPVYAGFGAQAILSDSGPASGGVAGLGFSELLLQVRGTGTPPYTGASSLSTGPDQTNVCDYDGPTVGTPYHWLCFSPNSLGGALIETGAGNGATAQPLNFKINGTVYQFPAAISGIAGPATSVVNDIACWNNTVGTLLKDCGSAPGTVTSVGLAMPNIFSISGTNPITGAGTFTVALASQSQNLVFASPNLSSGTPSFRALQPGDFGTQSANTVNAGPASGAAANPTYRALVGADLPTPSASTLGGIQSVTCATSNWINLISTSGVPTCTQPSYSDLAGSLPSMQLKGAPSGFVNKLRGTTLSQWYGGTSITVGTSPTWTAEGIVCLETGATVTASRVSNSLTNPTSFFALKLLGASSNTDVTCRFVISSYDAAVLAGQTITFQIPILNDTGGSLTPTITTKYPTTQDGSVTGGGNWAASTTDLTTKNLQSCANGATCTEAYTFTVNAGANNGYEIVIDFGALGTSAFVEIGGGFDLRLTPGVSTGANASPPAPEIYTTDRDAVWSQQFYRTSYDNGVAPGTITNTGQIIFVINTSSAQTGGAVEYTAMRADPAVTAYSPVTGTSGRIYSSGDAADTGNYTTGAGQNSFRLGGGGATFAAGALELHYTLDARIGGG